MLLGVEGAHAIPGALGHSCTFHSLQMSFHPDISHIIIVQCFIVELFVIYVDLIGILGGVPCSVE